MTSHTTPHIGRLLGFLPAALLITAVACGDNKSGRGDTNTKAIATDSAAGAAAGASSVDTQRTTTQLTPAAPAPQPTAEDAKVVRDALEYKLTEDNLNKFINAGNRLAFLRARDPQVRVALEQVGGTSAKNDDSALERLQRNPQISKAITDAGLSVRDYYTMSIAIASAQRFVDNPNAAPPTPTLSDNAKFLRDHKEHLAHLRVWGK
jgi:hypothetical protein